MKVWVVKVTRFEFGDFSGTSVVVFSSAAAAERWVEGRKAEKSYCEFEIEECEVAS